MLFVCNLMYFYYLIYLLACRCNLCVLVHGIYIHLEQISVISTNRHLILAIYE
jgi:hypothetical protein